MIVVIVAYQDEINRGQIRQPDSRIMNPFWTCKRDGRSSLRKNRIGQNINAVYLKQSRRMVDIGNRNTFSQPLLGHSTQWSVDKLRPVFGAGKENPA